MGRAYLIFILVFGMFGAMLNTCSRTSSIDDKGVPNAFDKEKAYQAEVLASGKTSRLYRALVFEQRIATGLPVNVVGSPAYWAPVGVAFDARAGDNESLIAAVEPATGHVVALVGGRDFTTRQFDLATQGYASAFHQLVACIISVRTRGGVSGRRPSSSSIQR